MKRISSVMLLLVLIILLSVTSVFGLSDCVEFYTDKNGNVSSYKKVYIDKGRGKYIVQVWVKEVFSDKGREKYIQDRTEKDSQLKDMTNYPTYSL